MSSISSELEAADLLSQLEEFVLKSEAVREARKMKAHEAVEYWKSIAPHWGDHDTKEAKPPTGLRRGGSGVPNYPDDYEKSIKVFDHGEHIAVGTELMPLAYFIEYGSEHIQEYGCGARTIEHFHGETGGDVGTHRIDVV